MSTQHPYDDEADLHPAEYGYSSYEGWDYSDEERVRQQIEAEQTSKEECRAAATQDMIDYLKRSPFACEITQHILKISKQPEDQKTNHIAMLMGHGPNGRLVDWSQVVIWLKSEMGQD